MRVHCTWLVYVYKHNYGCLSGCGFKAFYIWSMTATVESVTNTIISCTFFFSLSVYKVFSEGPLTGFHKSICIHGVVGKKISAKTCSLISESRRKARSTTISNRFEIRILSGTTCDNNL